MATATTQKPARRADDKKVTLTSRNGHGVRGSCVTMPAYAIDAARRVSASSMVVHGD